MKPRLHHYKLKTFNDPFVVFLFLLLLFSSLVFFSCSVTATRPTQLMADTEIAIKAAKDLNADSLSPDLYRSASEYFYKAKREYKVKNFESAENYALRARRYAEKAEYEAYLKGGANPEVANEMPSMEGATQDPESALKDAEGIRSRKSFEEQKAETERMQQEESARLEKLKAEYDLSQPEVEKAKAEQGKGAAGSSGSSSSSSVAAPSFESSGGQ